MMPQEMEDIEDLVSKIKAGKYKCGFAAQSAILDLYAECERLRAALTAKEKAEGENVALRNVLRGDEEQLKRVVDQNAALRDALVTEHQAGELREQELTKRAEKAKLALRSIAGSVGEFADADGKNIVEKIEFLRKDCEERIAVERANVDTVVDSCERLGCELADEKQKVANLKEYMLKGVAFRDGLQAQLCRAKEQLKLACKWLTSWMPDTFQLESVFRDINAIPSAPCPHAEEEKRLVDAMVRLLKSSDVSWYTGKHGGHDWREAVDEAHMLLVKVDRRRAGSAG